MRILQEVAVMAFFLRPVVFPRIHPPRFFAVPAKLLIVRNLFFFTPLRHLDCTYYRGANTYRKEDCGMLMKKLRFSKWLALSAPFCFATYVGAQSAPGQNTTRDNDIDVSRSVPDRDINHGDLSLFDQFLDDHREICGAASQRSLSGEQ